MIPCLPGVLDKAGSFTDTRWTLDSPQLVGSYALPFLAEDFMISPDGSRFYFCNEDQDAVYQIDLATPFIMSSSSYNGLLLSTGLTRTKGFTMNQDETKIYVQDWFSVGNAIHQYAVLNIADIGTATPDGITGEGGAATSVPRFNGDGTKLRTTQPTGSYPIYNKNLASPYLINGITGTDDTITPTPAISRVAASWKNDGTRFMDIKTGTVIRLNSMVNDDITTLTEIQTFDITTIIPGGSCVGVAVSLDGKNMYVLDTYNILSTINHFSL